MKPDSLAVQRWPAINFIKAGLICCLFVVTLLLSIEFSERFITIKPVTSAQKLQQEVVASLYEFVTIESMNELEHTLKNYNLWNVEKNSLVPAVILNRYPIELSDQPIKIKKRIFFNSLLPVALVVQNEIYRERQFLLSVIDQLKRFGMSAEAIVFDTNQNSRWQKYIDQTDIKTVLSLAKKYRSQSAEELLIRVDQIPVSLVLAQAAIESAWGSSRFAVNGNNLFGVWTWTKPGLVPSMREAGKSHKVAVYSSLLDSVRDYTLTINRGHAYEEFRFIRSNTRDSLQLAEGLINYSSRRSLYIDEVKSMIRVNQLQNYDTCMLASQKQRQPHTNSIL